MSKSQPERAVTPIRRLVVFVGASVPVTEATSLAAAHA